MGLVAVCRDPAIAAAVGWGLSRTAWARCGGGTSSTNSRSGRGGDTRPRRPRDDPEAPEDDRDPILGARPRPDRGHCDDGRVSRRLRRRDARPRNRTRSLSRILGSPPGGDGLALPARGRDLACGVRWTPRAPRGHRRRTPAPPFPACADRPGGRNRRHRGHPHRVRRAIRALRDPPHDRHRDPGRRRDRPAGALEPPPRRRGHRRWARARGRRPPGQDCWGSSAWTSRASAAWTTGLCSRGSARC